MSDNPAKVMCHHYHHCYGTTIMVILHWKVNSLQMSHQGSPYTLSTVYKIDN